MGLISTKSSVTLYRVEGEIDKPIIPTVLKCLGRHVFSETESELQEKVSGWTSFEEPFNPNFESRDPLIGQYFVFSLRIDRKKVPPKIIQKYYSMEKNRRMADKGGNFLSRNEKKEIKDRVILRLLKRIPSTPDLFDVVWNFENKDLYFFTNLKSANVELESLFYKSFRLNLIRLFPYTIADLQGGLKNTEKDVLNKLSATKFI
jgi:DNA recombination-dependent growth factor C